jgi:hypothetical protein
VSLDARIKSAHDEFKGDPLTLTLSRGERGKKEIPGSGPAMTARTNVITGLDPVIFLKCAG